MLVAVLMAQDVEFVFDRAPFASCHASTIVETSPGEFLAAWFGGSDEGKPDVAIWGARRSKTGWTEPVELAVSRTSRPIIPCCSRAGENPMVVLQVRAVAARWTGARRSSNDGGRTWSAIDHLPAGLYGPIKNKPLVLADGAVVSGVSVESYHAWSAWVERSGDGGRTWTKHGPIVVPRQPYGVIQPALVRLRDGRLRMYLRSTELIRRICYADSSDAGRTWTPAQRTELPNPNSGIDAVTLKDGRILLVYNRHGEGTISVERGRVQ